MLFIQLYIQKEGMGKGCLLILEIIEFYSGNRPLVQISLYILVPKKYGITQLDICSNLGQFSSLVKESLTLKFLRGSRMQRDYNVDVCMNSALFDR